MNPDEAATKIQRRFRQRIYRFHRWRLIERLELEIQLGVMGMRFWAFFAIFALLCVIVKFPFDSTGDLLIRRQVAQALQLESLTMKSRTEMKTAWNSIVDAVDAAFRPKNGELVDVYAMSPNIFALDAGILQECTEEIENEARANPGKCPDFCEVSGCPVIADPSGFNAQGKTLFTTVPDVKFFRSMDFMLTIYSPVKRHLGVFTLRFFPDYKFDYSFWFVDHIANHGWYVTAVVLAYLLVASQILVDVWYIVRVRGYVNKRHHENLSHVLEVSGLVVLVVFLSFHISVWGDSESAFQEYTDKLTALNGEEYYYYMQDLVDVSKEQGRIKVFGFACLYLTLMRLGQSMLMHPRIALFVRTFTTAKSEIKHFFITAAFLFMGLGMVGWTTLRTSDADYRTFRDTIWAQFTSVAANSITADQWTRYPVYHVLFTLLVILCLLNFFTAVIIDTYLKLREQVETQITEQSIVSDLIDTARLQILFRKFRFPNRRHIVEKLSKMKALRTVTLQTLWNTRLFPDKETCRKFCAAYRRFPFLHAFEFQAPHDAGTRRWAKALERLDDLAVDAHLDVEVVDEYDMEISRRMEKVERVVDAVSHKLSVDNFGSSVGRHAASTFLRRRRNLFDEYRVRRETLKKVKNILHQMRVKEYMHEASTDAAIKYLIEKKLVRRRFTFVSNRRRTLTNSQRSNN